MSESDWTGSQTSMSTGNTQALIHTQWVTPSPRDAWSGVVGLNFLVYTVCLCGLIVIGWPTPNIHISNG